MQAVMTQMRRKSVQEWLGLAHWSSEVLTETFLRIPQIDDKLYYINHQLLAPFPKTGGTNSSQLGGTWYFMSWYPYKRPPSVTPTVGTRASKNKRRRLLLFF